MDKPMVVILEDDLNRVEKFLKKFGKDANLKVFDNVDDCKDFVLANKDLVSGFFLDHDLGGQTYVNSEEHNTGYTMAKVIKEIYGDEYPFVIIHSMNPAGSENIQSVLNKAVKIPFYAISDVSIKFN